MTFINRLLITSALILPAAAYGQSTDDTPKESTHIDLETIVVTGSPLARPLGRTITAVSVLDGEELAENLENTIGETLRRIPGVTSTYFGAGAGRPIIRGLGGDRIRVLNDGIGTFDAAQTSPDHAVPVEPALAERVEVFRGAASLLYGSSAAGGVVNVLSNRIPREKPEDGIEGAARYSHSTVNDADELAGGFNLGVGDFVFHGEGFWRDADNFDIPGSNASDQLLASIADGDFLPLIDPDDDLSERFTNGFVGNSDLQTDGGSGGVSWLFDLGEQEGYIGFSASLLNTNYGIPAGVLTEEDLEGGEEGEEGEEEEEEGGIRIDLEQVRYDLEGQINGDLGVFETAKLRLGYGDYRHVELEGDEVGTLFENDEVEGRLELVGKPFAALGGQVRTATGVQGRYRDFSAVGAEAFVPPSDQTQFAVFALGEYSRGALVVDLSGRYERVNNETSGFIAEEDGDPITVENTYNNLSVSGGVGYALTDDLFVGVNGFRTERAPSLEENFSFGPHLATQFFEIGDPTLDEEVARGVEATVRGQFGPLTAVVNGFVTNYDDFIFEQATGEIEDNLPVFAFTAADTTFRGTEAQFDLDIGGVNAPILDRVEFAANAQVAYVRATSGDLAGDQDQPRIPPLSTLFGLSASSDLVSLRGEVEYVTAQDNIAAFELPTDSYVFVNAYLTVRPFRERPNLAIDIRARNIGDEEGRVHSSFLKDTVPLPGRDVRVALRVAY